MAMRISQLKPDALRTCAGIFICGDFLEFDTILGADLVDGLIAAVIDPFLAAGVDHVGPTLKHLADEMPAPTLTEQSRTQPWRFGAEEIGFNRHEIA
jgi:hypothetical protein